MGMIIRVGHSLRFAILDILHMCLSCRLLLLLPPCLLPRHPRRSRIQG